jgi:hypothetical protein
MEHYMIGKHFYPKAIKNSGLANSALIEAASELAEHIKMRDEAAVLYRTDESTVTVVLMPMPDGSLAALGLDEKGKRLPVTLLGRADDMPPYAVAGFMKSDDDNCWDFNHAMAIARHARSQR